MNEFISKSETVNALQASGKSRHPTDFPILQYYLNDTNSHPFVKNFSETSINHIEFLKEFTKLSHEIVHQRENYDEECSTSRVECAYYKIAKGYFVELSSGYQSVESYSSNIQDFLKSLSKKENTAVISSVTLYCPSDSSPLKNLDLETKIIELIYLHKVSRNTTTPCIGMICSEDGDYYIKDFYIKKDYEIKNGDLHYGPGFMDFNTKLIERFKVDSKGLVLLHGLPGTGKTYYIRNLLKELIKIGKYVIYLPPGMMDFMSDPNMMNFLSNTVLDKAEDNKSCVLLLEDAEPLLTSRNIENRSGGITNLLNVTDGLLNDMLNIQVIATFNTELSNIDDALLRPERLIARKEFKKLKQVDAQLLANTLDIKKKITEDSTLAEIYSQSNDNEILIHEYNNEKRSIGFNRMTK